MPVQELRVVSTARQGFVLMRALSEQPSLYSRAQAQARVADLRHRAAFRLIRR